MVQAVLVEPLAAVAWLAHVAMRLRLVALQARLRALGVLAPGLTNILKFEISDQVRNCKSRVINENQRKLQIQIDIQKALPDPGLANEFIQEQE